MPHRPLLTVLSPYRTDMANGSIYRVSMLHNTMPSP